MSGERLERLLDLLANMAAGETHLRIPVSPARDELDAIAFGINMLAAELTFTSVSRDALATVIHELRSPLHVILSHVNVLLRDDLTPERRTASVRAVDRSSRTLLQLVQDLLDLSSIAAGRLNLEKEPLSPLDLIGELVAGMEPQVREKGLYLELQCQETCPDRVVSDPLRVKQIATNLISNAVKFTREGGVTVILGGSARSWVVDIVDTGMGVPAEKQGRLFTAFYQVNPSYGGSGLGLYLSRALAERLGGYLTLLWSEENRGSCFRLAVPVGATQPA